MSRVGRGNALTKFAFARTIIYTFYLMMTLLFVPSCGQSDMYRKFQNAQKKQDEISLKSLPLWKRSPTVDGGDATLSAASNLDLVPRSYVSFSDLLDQNKALESEWLRVVNSSLNPKSISFFDFAGKRAAWDDDDFQMLMAFHHGSKAFNYAKKLFPNANYAFRIKNSANKLIDAKLLIYAVERGDVFSTSYDPTIKAVSFYRNSTSGPYSRFNPVLEGDAIYHEIAHYVMHSLTCPVASACDGSGGVSGTIVNQSIGTNSDMDSLQEGLADFFAAAVAGDDRNFTFFNNNARNLVSNQSRLGIDFFRSVANDLYFPSAFRQAFHLDGRVISGALNDFRKFLNGQLVKKTNCTSNCNITGRSPALSAVEATDYTVKLAFNAFSRMTSTSTLQDFSQTLLELCGAGGANCPDNAQSLTFLQVLLNARGLISTVPQAPPQSAVVIGSNQGTADLFVYPDLGWKPYPDNGQLADADSYLEPCELVMVYPKVENTSFARAQQLQFYWVKAQLVESTNFTAASIAGKALDPLLAGSIKLLGWFDPQERSEDLINQATSRLYTNNGLSTFTKGFGKNFNVPTVGWIVHAPNEVGKTGTMTFKFSVRIYNTRSGLEFWSSADVTSSLSTLSNAEATAAQNSGGIITQYNCQI